MSPNASDGGRAGGRASGSRASGGEGGGGDAITSPGDDDFGLGGPAGGGTHGVLPVLPPDMVPPPEKNPRGNAATAATAAGARAFTAQAVAFYFRAPAKAFFRMRVDYLAFARNIHLDQHLPHASSSTGPLLRPLWYWLRGTTPGLLTGAIRHQGWSVVHEHVLPPLLANVAVGAVLYSSYLQILGRLHEDSARASKRVYPPPSPGDTFTAGLLAGAIQSFVAAPLDAVQARYDHRDVMGTAAGSRNGRPVSMWAFGAAKLREIGARGIFAGWSLSLTKDGLGSAVFFSTFEYVKAQGYYRFVRWYYGGLSEDKVDLLSRRRPTAAATATSSPSCGAVAAATSSIDGDSGTPSSPTAVIRPHYAIEPMFLLLAGLSASVAQQVAVYPVTHIQLEHFNHLEDLDAKARQIRAASAAAAASASSSSASSFSSTKSSGSAPPQPPSSSSSPPSSSSSHRWRMWRAYYHAYQETWAQCRSAAALERRRMVSWLYRGFWWNTIRQVPSTSAGLVIFELVRRKYGMGGDEVRITRDGYDILLS